MRPYYYLGDDRALTTLADGSPFFVNTRDIGITTWIILGGHWETFADEILCGVVRSGDHVLDAGANQGYYTVRMGQRVGPGGHVTAFEPNPQLLPVLRNNAAINGLAERCTIYPCGLADAAGTAPLSFTYANMGGGTLLAKAGQGPHDDPSQPVNVETIEIVAGDDVLADDTVFDVMKFDIEGYEPLAALGLEKVIARSGDAAIMVEIAPRDWLQFGDLGTLLARFTRGHRQCYRMGHDGLLDPFDAADEATLAHVADVADPFYLLMMPPLHWAMDFVRSRCRPTP